MVGVWLLNPRLQCTKKPHRGSARKRASSFTRLPSWICNARSPDSETMGGGLTVRYGWRCPAPPPPPALDVPVDPDDRVVDLPFDPPPLGDPELDGGGALRGAAD